MPVRRLHDDDAGRARRCRRGLRDRPRRVDKIEARDYDVFLDFGIPSPITLDNRLTIDGTHYSPDANDVVARGLMHGAGEMALDVKAMTLEEYRAAVHSRLRAFAAEHHLLGMWKH